MAIPWATALLVFKKLMPVIVDRAPEFLNNLERYRKVSTASVSATSDPSLEMLQAQLDTHQQAIALQTETIARLQTRLSATRRSLTIAWSVLIATALLSASILVVLLSRS
ncbi:MAG: hypothetical protein K0S45_2343 [Nitrospira sp.]|jgi:hypothetical protein|nr:hypothetical protein [Nitrospira sp.]